MTETTATTTIDEGHYLVGVECPNCRRPVTLPIEIVSKLTTEPTKSTLTVRLVTKGAPHRCVDDQQRSFDDLVDADDDRALAS